MRLTEAKNCTFSKVRLPLFSSGMAGRHTAHIQTLSLLFPPFYFIPSCHSISLPSLCYSSQINVSWGRPPHILSQNNVLWMCPRDYMWHSPRVSSSHSPTQAGPSQNLEGRAEKKQRGSIFYHPKLTVKQCAQSKYYQRVYPFQMWKSKVGHTLHSL